MDDRSLFLIDGENFILRYQDGIKQKLIPRKEVIHEEDSFLWCPQLTQLFILNLVRVSYYTTCVGDNNKIAQLRKRIASTVYDFQSHQGDGQGTLVPHIFKKEGRNKKTKSVDINLTIDALRHTYNNSIHKIYLLSGDGDYIPLIEEVMRQGKQAAVLAFSNGLNSTLADSCDDFINLDEVFFKKTKEQKEK